MPQQRRGVAQGQQLHVLLKGGDGFLEQLLPGIRGNFVAARACEVRDPKDLLLFERGHWSPRRDFGSTILCLSRPAYEKALRERVSSIPNVVIRDRRSVDSLVIQSCKLIGVRGRRSVVDEGDLFVLANGRSGNLARMLADAGLQEVPTTELKIEVHYSTGRFRKSDRYKGEAQRIVCFPAPPEVSLGLLVPVENDEWLIALGGRFEQRAPTDQEGFRKYASSLPIGDIADRLRDAELVEPLRSYRVRSSTWWHHDRCADLPDRLIPIADSIASYNPTYGQGMSVAAGHALALRNALLARMEARDGLDHLARDYFAKAMELTAQAWTMAAMTDLEYEKTGGHRSPDYAKRLAWAEATRRAARRHPEVQKLRWEIGHLLTPPSAARDGPLAPLIAAELGV